MVDSDCGDVGGELNTLGDWGELGVGDDGACEVVDCSFALVKGTDTDII